ncbi:MAG: diguanylate cyclase [Deltaproteobacteria bacterium]|nr:diguanylate cyclase [Deltaproteobacteria bacterium]
MRENWKDRPGSIAVLDGNPFMRMFIGEVLRQDGHGVHDYERGQDLIDEPDLDQLEVLVAEIAPDSAAGLALIERLRIGKPRLEIVVVTRSMDVDTAVRAMRAGVFDYLLRPVEPEVLKLTVARALEKRRLLEQNRSLQRSLELALAGQRVLASESPDQLAETTLQALLTHLLGAAGTVSVGSALCIRNLEVHEADKAVALMQQAVPGSAVACDASAVGSRFGRGMVARFGTAEQNVSAWICRPVGYAEPGREDLGEAEFLLRHALNALINARTYARARDEALRDALTGLFNARYLEEALSFSIKNGEYNSTPVAVLFADIDRFKEVNDHHGHLVGSKVLVELGRVFSRCVREGDVVARFGGDEFVLLLEHASAEGGLRVAERIRRTVEQHTFLAREGSNVRLTICIGVACFPDHGADPRELCALADGAMYLGKAGTRNTVHLASVAR